MRWPLILPILVAGCHQPAPAPAPAASPTAGGYAAKIAGLPDTLRAGVMLRAIRDAGQDCQRVIGSEPASGATPPAWIATCDDKHRWVVSIADDGTATVIDGKDAAGGR